MSLLTPLGLLALIGILVLILIYLLKPNYQQKVVSSTFVWKLSLKYKKKRLPISRFRNILLLICQLLVIAACALLLTQPFIPSESNEHKTEKIIILDASASMLAESGNATRFERAVAEATELSEEVLSSADGMITVILAGETPTYVLERVGSTAVADVETALGALIEYGESACTFGTVDMDGAVDLAGNVLVQNPDAEIILYTDTEYIDKAGITVKKMTDVADWNAAVLGCSAEVIDRNFYTFKIDVASYGRDTELKVICEISGVNAEERTVSLEQNVYCNNDETVTVIFDEFNSDIAVYSYDTVHVYFDNVIDSFEYDDEFWLYGGKKEKLRIQYASSGINPFFGAAFMALRENLRSTWDIEIKEVTNGKPETSGFDFYMFEYDAIPSTMPTDGVVMFSSPQKALPAASGIVLKNIVPVKNAVIDRGNPHPFTEYLPLDNLGVNRYQSITVADGFEELLYLEGNPVFLVKNEEAVKIIAMLFGVDMSWTAVFVDFPMLMGNIFEYLFPATTDKYVYDVGESVLLKARGSSMTVSSDTLNEVYTEHMQSIKPTAPGSYNVRQPIMGNDAANVKVMTSNFFVKVPASESNIRAVEEGLKRLDRRTKSKPADIDIVLYFAIALVTLLFAERLLQSRDQF